MKAWHVGKLGEPSAVMTLADVTPAALRPGHVRVRVEHAALNFLDVLLCRGAYDAADPPLPFTPGVEAAGTVTEVAGPAEVAVGDRVVVVPGVGHGTLAEDIVVPAKYAFPLPDGLGTAEAACLMVTYQTAWVGLHRLARLAPREVVLVHAGAGGVGTAAIQLAVARGARVLVTASTEEKRRLCRDLGAELAIDYRAEGFVKPVLERTDGRGADVIVDPVGGEVLTRSLECLALEGRLVVVGFSDGVPPPLSAPDIAAGNYGVMGVSWGRHYPQRRLPIVRDIFDELVSMHAAGTVAPTIFARYPFQESPRALQALGDGATWGKVVVDGRRPD